MDFWNLKDAAVSDLFRTMFQKRNIVPVFGAGFTRGAQTRASKVPDGEEFRQIMLRAIENGVGDEVDAIKNLGFSEVAEHFLNKNFVPTAVVKSIVEKYFTSVVLSEESKALLQCPWPYIYTLNIDDAIERNSVFVNKVLPNRTISASAKALECVYKVHGDAVEELMYDEPSKIIFSTGQYLRSLTTNSSMLNSLKTDLTEQNAIFIGCSLEYEIDLLYALAEFQGKFRDGRRSIFVTRKNLNRFNLAKLASHGVNTILQIADYKEFYSVIAAIGRSSYSVGELNISSYRVDGKTWKVTEDRDLNLNILLRAQNQADNRSILPSYRVTRDIESEIMKGVTRAPLSILRGRRFSGRTLLLKSIALLEGSRNVYFFGSDVKVSKEVIDEIARIRNGLFLFDTNTLSPSSAEALVSVLEKHAENGNAAIVAVNSTEPDVIGVLIRHVDDDENDFDVDARFSKNECDRINGRLDYLGIRRFDFRKTILENTFSHLDMYQQIRSTLVCDAQLNDKEVELLLITAVMDKAYSNMATAVGLRANDIFDLCVKLAPTIEVSVTSKAELRDNNSRYKVIINSKTGLAVQLQRVISENGVRWLAERIESIVGKLLKNDRYSSVAKSMYMFDAINYLLSQTQGGSERAGYRTVVLSLYKNLQPSLSGTADYWLQRAKAILSLENDIKLIIEGIEYAQKAFHEAERSRTADNAEFIIALLYGKLCDVTQYKDAGYVNSAVSWFYRAVTNYKRNPHYVEAMLEGVRYRRNSFQKLCDYLDGSIKDSLKDPKILLVKGEVDYLLDIRKKWRQSK